MVATRKRTILIVDDERAVRETMRMLLKDSYRCLLARGYREGLNLLLNENIDVVLLDYNLGVTDHNGLDLLSAAKKARVNARFIVVTGTSQLGLEEQSKSLGASLFFDKPLDNDELIDAIESVIPNQSNASHEQNMS